MAGKCIFVFYILHITVFLTKQNAAVEVEFQVRQNTTR